MRFERVVPFEAPVQMLDFEDVVCLCNPTQSADLTHVLEVTQPERRLGVAMAWMNIQEQKDLLRRTGTHSSDVALLAAWSRWLSKHNRMPLGAACRLARVFGVGPELLLEWYIK